MNAQEELRNELYISISKKHSNICTNDYSIKMKFAQVGRGFYSNWPRRVSGWEGAALGD